MSLWFTESDSNTSHGYAISKILFSGQSDFQKVDVIETRSYGRMLVIDDCVMITDKDEFVYHEMISHIPMGFHPAPEKIVIIGGGDGGTVREFLRYPGVEEIVLCEIDKMVVDASKEFFPEVAKGLGDPRVKVRIGDGIAYMAELNSEVDIVVIDSTDPIGPGEGLFTGSFYKSVANALKPGGLMVAQSESPWYEKAILARIQNNIKQGFSCVRPYIGTVPTYPTGLWSWTVASNSDLSLEKFDINRFESISKNFKYLTSEGIKAAFTLPPFFADKI